MEIKKKILKNAQKPHISMTTTLSLQTNMILSK